MKSRQPNLVLLLMLTSPLAVLLFSLLVQGLVGASFNIMGGSSHWSITTSILAFLAAQATAPLTVLYCLIVTKRKAKQLANGPLFIFWLNALACIGFALLWLYLLFYLR